MGIGDIISNGIAHASQDKMECDKKTYETPEEAKGDMIGLRRRTKHQYHVYKCRTCQKYHIATTNKNSLVKYKNDKSSKYPIKLDFPIERKDRNKPKTK